MQYLYISELDVEGSPACLAPTVCVCWEGRGTHFYCKNKVLFNVHSHFNTKAFQLNYSPEKVRYCLMQSF